MSYDLIVRSAPPAAEATLERLSLALTTTPVGGVVALPNDDAAVAKAFKTLINWALEVGATLHDPQAGADINLADPGRFPPGWVPTGPVPGANLKAKVKHFLADHLRVDDFQVRDAWTATRPGGHLTQGLYFQAGTGVRSGRFTATVFWNFHFRPWVHPSQMTVTARLGRFLGQAHDGWLAATPSTALEKAFAQVQFTYQKAIRPLLDQVRTVVGLVATFEAGHLAVPEAFGPDPRDMADCYAHLGRSAEGLARYEAFLQAYVASADPHQAQWATGQLAAARDVFLGPPLP